MEALSTWVDIKLNHFKGNLSGLCYIFLFRRWLPKPGLVFCPSVACHLQTLHCPGLGTMKPWALVFMGSPYLCGCWNLSLGLRLLTEMWMDLSPWVHSWSMSCGYPLSHSAWIADAVQFFRGHLLCSCLLETAGLITVQQNWRPNPRSLWPSFWR